MRTIVERIAAKIAARRTVGWFDYSSDSYDMRVANARACRIVMRAKFGERTSLREHM